MKIKKEVFGVLNNETIYEYTLTNSHNLSLSVISYGGIITKINMPDRNGKIEGVTINVDNLDDIVKSRPFHGALIGPVTGRITDGRYFDGEKTIQLDQNEGKNTLHSGVKGFDNRIWTVETQEQDKQITLILTSQFKDGASGFPGNVHVTVYYSLNEDGEVTIRYEAKTDKKTIFNPTNHVYFNLSGDNKEPIYNHQFELASNHYAVLDEDNLPTGKLKPVEKTDFDFRKARALEHLLEATDKQITSREGLDHPFCLNQDKLETAASLYHHESGRLLEMFTNADAVVVYTHNHEQKMGENTQTLFGKHSGIALETSALPDAVNHEDFGSIWLDKNKIFSTETTYKFSIKE